jgi:glycosyltransferase involved in cell wall biosynthesis
LDDGSIDTTAQILKKYTGRIIWETHQNIGETRTVNKGFRMASGEVVCVINSDDPMLKDSIQSGVEALLKYPDALAAYPDWDEIDVNSKLIMHRVLPEYNIMNMLTDFNVAVGPGVFIRRSAIEKYGGRDERFKYVGDLEYWFRLALHGQIVHIPSPLATHRVHPGAASVAEQGARMADELIEMLDKIFASDILADNVRLLHRKIYSQAHYVATSYCGRNQKAYFKHLLLSFRYYPMRLFWLIFNKPHQILWKVWKKIKKNFQVQSR